MSRRLCFLVVCLAVFFPQARAELIRCELRPAEDGFRGHCVDPSSKGVEIHLVSGGSSPRFTLRGTLAIEEGMIPISVAPPSDDFYAAGILETPYRWIELERFARRDDGMRFSFDWNGEAKPGARDLQILDQAGKILSDPTSWDREDDGTCKSEKRSLFCALLQATFEVMGEPHHRQPALQAVRREIDAAAAERIRSHRLVDFNNHANTTFEEVHDVLRNAAEAVRMAIPQRADAHPHRNPPTEDDADD